MTSRRGPSGQKKVGEKGKGTASRRKFLKRIAYVAPAIITFVATRANAQGTTCAPAQCRPASCSPGDCGPGPCPPAACRPNN